MWAKNGVLRAFRFSILMTYPFLPCPNKSRILEKESVSQNEEEKEKLMVFKKFQCLLYFSQSHTGFGHTKPATFIVLGVNFWNFLHIIFSKTIILSQEVSFPMDWTSLSMFPHTKHSAICPSPWHWAQNYFFKVLW